jgi:hypothetical protein
MFQNGRKIFVRYSTDKGLTSMIYKKLIFFSKEQINQLISRLMS